MTSSPLGWLRSLSFSALFYGWSVIIMLALLPTLPFVQERTVRRYAVAWMRGTHALLGATVGLRYRWEGLENLPTEPVIIASKHQSAWETLAFHILRPDLVIGLKRELANIPVFGWYLRRGGMIVIDRGGAAKSLRSLVTGAQDAMRRGCSLLIFPEGTRTAPGDSPDYKSGVAALYAALNVPVVPVALNSGMFWGRRSFLKKPGTITVSLLKPIPPGLDRRSFMAQLQEAIETRTDALVMAARNESDRL